MYVIYEYALLVAGILALSVVLFVASALVLMAEEAAKAVGRSTRLGAVQASSWAASHFKELARNRSAAPNPHQP